MSISPATGKTLGHAHVTQSPGKVVRAVSIHAIGAETTPNGRSLASLEKPARIKANTLPRSRDLERTASFDDASSDAGSSEGSSTGTESSGGDSATSENTLAPALKKRNTKSDSERPPSAGAVLVCFQKFAGVIMEKGARCGPDHTRHRLHLRGNAAQ